MSAIKDFPIVVRGPLEDLSDVVRIARVQGRIVLKVKKVKVKPIVYPHGNDYVVMVEPLGSGSSKLSAVRERKQNKD